MSRCSDDKAVVSFDPQVLVHRSGKIQIDASGRGQSVRPSSRYRTDRAIALEKTAALGLCEAVDAVECAPAPPFTTSRHEGSNLKTAVGVHHNSSPYCLHGFKRNRQSELNVQLCDFRLLQVSSYDHSTSSKF